MTWPPLLSFEEVITTSPPEYRFKDSFMSTDFQETQTPPI